MIQIKAVIFDMDGVISDTQSVCSSVESALFSEYGILLTPQEITERYSGISSKVLFVDLFQQANLEMPNLEDLMAERRRRIDDAVRGCVRAIPGTIEFINRLKSLHIPMAVASASHPSFIELVLKELDIRNDFEVICSSYEVEKGKPDPDVFLLAAKRLSIDPGYCLVIEDGVSGMIAAKKADMCCVGLVKKEGDRDDLVDITVRHLTDERIFGVFNFSS